jgi:hypothetical protein
MKNRSPDRDGRRLSSIFRSLRPEDRYTLLRFAEFLAAEAEATAVEQGPIEPEALPRPSRESVVGAIKRLSRTYHMLDRSRMLNETSSLMAAHVIQGRPAVDVIDELEVLFARHYADYRGESPD